MTAAASTAAASGLRDQRVMIAKATRDDQGRVVLLPAYHETAGDVAAAWKDWATHMGFEMRRRKGDYTTELRRSRRTLRAYVSGGSWVADCPDCNDAAACWPAHDKACCLGCGTIYTIEFPARSDIEEAASVLLGRVREEQAWRCDRGETVAELKAQNLVHGDPLSGLSQTAADELMIHRFIEQEGEPAVRMLERLGVLGGGG